MKTSFKHYGSTIELTLRVFTALYMLRYGMVKLNGEQFAYGKDLYAKTINELSGMDLMWVFFSYSEPFSAIVGCLQIVGGVLLFFNKTKLIAVCILFPILLNILLMDIFYAGYPILQATINVSLYLLVLALVCYNARPRILKILNILLINTKKSLSLKEKTFQIFLVLLGVVLIYFILNLILKQIVLGINFQSEIFR
jgi:uncharacterized membrane protein YphA (DoxX/SURF4 family)